MKKGPDFEPNILKTRYESMDITKTNFPDTAYKNKSVLNWWNPDNGLDETIEYSKQAGQ